MADTADVTAAVAALALAGKAQQFSEDEAKRIAALREMLPAALEAAAAEEPVGASLWGVDLLSGGGSGERDLRVDVVLAKFLRARNGDMEQALAMLIKTLQWRASFDIDGLMDEAFPEDVFGSVGFVFGRDKEGRPVTYNFYGGLDNKMVFGDLDRFLRWRVQLHERGMRSLDFVDVADMVQVHDYAGVGLLSYDGYARAASKATVQLMSDHYPETLATKFFVNVPGWGETIFNLIGRWLSEETKRKFVVASSSTAAAALAQRIDPDSLPDKFRPAAAAAAEPTKTVEEGPTRTDGDSAQSPPSPQPAHLAAAEELVPPTDAPAERAEPAEPCPDTITAAPAEDLPAAEPE
ncbi:Non-classical phosphatidylinositol transfer protein (PITP), partial [Coemansia nantahalensis]